MGFTEVKLTLRHPKDGDAREITLLVDSGALYSLVPAVTLKELGIQPTRERSFQLADGRIIKRRIGEAKFEYKNEESTSPVIFGEAGDMPVMGVVTLESLGLELDPIRKELRPARLLLI